MTFEEKSTFDPAIWVPDLLGMLIKNEVGPTRRTLLCRQDFAFNRNKKIVEQSRTERLAKPNDWLIEKRNEILLQLATCWIELHDTRTPFDFCTDIWIPVTKAYLSCDGSRKAFAPAIEKYGLLELNEVNYQFTQFICGLFWCLFSMDSLESGEIAETVSHLMSASVVLGQLEVIGAQHQQGVDDATIQKSKSLSAFAQLGAAGRNAKNRAIKAEVLEHYMEHGHGFSKESAAADIAEKFGKVSARTVGKWLIRVKPRNPKSDALPD